MVDGVVKTEQEYLDIFLGNMNWNIIIMGGMMLLTFELK